MCPPALSAAAMFATSLAVSAVTGAVSYMGAKNTADAQYAAQVQNNKMVREASIADLVAQGGDLNARQLQEQAATAVNVQNQKLAAKRASSTATASSESAGMSVDALLADYDRQYLNYADSQMQNLGFNVEQIQRTREGLESQAKSRINTGSNLTPVSQPSLIGTVGGIAASGLTAYSNFAVRDPLTGKYTIT
jgi:hypothetical protein